ncbi:MAG: hypothetical protein ACYCVD_18685 [Desulfitobacteriaceae bacterium]
MAQKSEDTSIAALARSVLFLAIRRIDLVYRAGSRISCVKNLLTQLPPISKILIIQVWPDSKTIIVATVRPEPKRLLISFI